MASGGCTDLSRDADEGWPSCCGCRAAWFGGFSNGPCTGMLCWLWFLFADGLEPVRLAKEKRCERLETLGSCGKPSEGINLRQPVPSDCGERPVRARALVAREPCPRAPSIDQRALGPARHGEGSWSSSADGGDSSTVDNDRPLGCFARGILGSPRVSSSSLLGVAKSCS